MLLLRLLIVLWAKGGQRVKSIKNIVEVWRRESLPSPYFLFRNTFVNNHSYDV